MKRSFFRAAAVDVNGWRKSFCEQYWTSPGDNTLQSSSCMATDHPSRKLSRTRHAGHCWRSRDELINDVLLWTPSHGPAKGGWPAQTSIQQLCVYTRCSPEDRPKRWTIGRGGERGSGYPGWERDMKMIYIYINIYIYIYNFPWQILCKLKCKLTCSYAFFIISCE